MRDEALIFAKRTEPFQESVIREMTRLGEETGSVNLSQGLPDYDSPPEVLAAAVEAIRRGENQYTFPFGLPEFRAAIAGKYREYNHIAADPETDITVTCGVSEAMMSTILALTDPGDEVIILEPWYENYLPDCQMAGVAPRFVPLREPDYTFDLQELRAAFNQRTRLILINTPHNPTGKVFTRAELEMIAGLCQEFGVIAVTDEIYEYILYDGREHVSIGSLPGMEDRAVTISGLGKTYALTGWRVGWTVAHPRITGLVRKVHDYLTICAPAPFQAAGITALGMPEAFYSGLREEYAFRRAILLDALRAAGLAYRQPEGAYYVMVDFGGLDWDARKYARAEWSLDRVFAEHMAREVGVAVVPGSSFYYQRGGDGAGTSFRTSFDAAGRGGDGRPSFDAAGRGGEMRVRINFAKREDTLREAARRLKKLEA